MVTFSYRSFVDVGDLQVGECTIHHADDGKGARFWHMWFRVNRDSDGQPDTFLVPVIPGGAYTESGPGGRSWGLNRSRTVSTGWDISPSINVLDTGELHPGPHAAPSLWHQTPTVVEVPDGEAWMTGAP